MQNKTKQFILVSAVVFGLLFSASNAFAAAPTLIANPAISITQTQATLSGSFIGGGNPSTDVRFEYGTTSMLGSSTPYVTKNAPNGSFTAVVTNLQPNTMYWFRAMGVNADGPGFSSPLLTFTTTGYSLASVSTYPATGLGQTTATLNGAFMANGSSTSTSFEFASNASLVGSTILSYSPQTGNNGTFTASISGLSPNTTYYFRALAKNSAGTTYGTPILPFKTLPITTTYACSDSLDNDSDGLIDYPNDPGCSSGTDDSEINTIVYQCADGLDNDNDGLIDYPSDPGCSSTTDNSEINSSNTYQCSDGIDNDNDGLIDYPSDPGCSSTTDNSETNSVSQCTINYFYTSSSSVDSGDSVTLYWGTTDCNYASIDHGIGNVFPVSSGNYQTYNLYNDTTFTLSASGNSGNQSLSRTVFVNDGNNNGDDEPSVDTLSAINIDEESATLRGRVNPNGDDTESWFEWGSGSSLNHTVAFKDLGSGTSDKNISYSLSNLNDDTRYSFRACASNSFGDLCGETLHFTTDSNDDPCNNCHNDNGDGPNAFTDGASAVSGRYATLNGHLTNISGIATIYAFQYGTNPNFLNSATTSHQTSPYFSTGNLSETLSNLSLNTTYYYRLYAANDNGTDYGEIRSFTTGATGGTTTVVYNTPTASSTPGQTIVYNTTTTNTTTNTNGESSSSSTSSNLVSIKIDTPFDTVRVGGDVSFSVSYKNISSQTLKNVVLTVATPREITFRQATSGFYSGNTLTVNVGVLAPGDGGNVMIDARLSENSTNSNLIVTTATLTFTKKDNNQDQAVAYAFTKTNGGDNSLAGLALFGSNTFLPHNLAQWLLLILVILALIMLSRTIFSPRKADSHAPAHH